ncbi:MAG: tripartite tricarboxylate transporter permease [Deltaproteobacteria bacterium]|nr:tripartite tricarboxylate transporter permease [Deltaproteobacteria bacterium]
MELLSGFASAFQYILYHPLNWLLLVLGVIWGILFGCIPGLTGIVGVALLIPFTFTLDPIEGLLMLGAVYCGSTFGGSISAILFNTPGAPEAACTTLDGYPMARQGHAGKAIGYALGASAIGGLFGTIVLILMAPPLAEVALDFGPSAYFALAVLGITAIASIGTKSVFKSLLSGMLGLGLATVGMDPLTSTARFNFGSSMLLTGISFIPAIIGLFALAEVLKRSGETRKGQILDTGGKVRTELPTLKEIWSLKIALLRSSIIGTIIGVLPGVGATTASFIGYSEAVRWSRHPERFGTGVPEGIVSPEAANNGAVGGSMVPLLSLGIPGSATTAVMIGGLTIHGIIPGPMLMVQNQDLVYSIFIGMLAANLLMIFFGIKIASHFAKVLKVPYVLVGPCIIVLCMTGVFALRNNMMDLVVMLALGAFGYLLQVLDYPIAPLIIGLVLGPVAEISLRRAMILTNFDFIAVITEPIAGAMLLISAVSLCYGLYGQYKNAMKRRQAAGG